MYRMDEILRTEYSEKFDELRKKAMVTSFYKYGPAEANYHTNKTIDAVESLRLRLNAYERTGNTEYLVDVANFAMLEFMYPQHEHAHYIDTDGGVKIAGVGINQIKEADSVVQ